MKITIEDKNKNAVHEFDVDAFFENYNTTLAVCLFLLLLPQTKRESAIIWLLTSPRDYHCVELAEAIGMPRRSVDNSLAKARAAFAKLVKDAKGRLEIRDDIRVEFGEDEKSEQ